MGLDGSCLRGCTVFPHARVGLAFVAAPFFRRVWAEAWGACRWAGVGVVVAFVVVPSLSPLSCRCLGFLFTLLASGAAWRGHYKRLAVPMAGLLIRYALLACIELAGGLEDRVGLDDK